LLTFLEEIVGPLINRGENLLVFTEYRATQEYLRQRLISKFPQIRGIELINGSMQLDDKMASVFRFNESESQILISTEAGGEGLNLQKSCHVMVNYDLPWNPSRLVQRIGRLYRYGQTKRVQVINLQTNDFFDNQALSLMLDKVTTMANDMAAISVENKDALAADILGELLSNIDMEDILKRSEQLTIERTEDEIVEAIKRAKEARFMEEDILQYSSNASTRVLSGFDQRHIISFVEGMAQALNIKLRSKQHKGQTLELELPEDYIGRWPEFGRKGVVKLSVDQERVRRSKDLIPMDFECSFVSELAEMAQDRKFDGLYAESSNQNLATLISLHQVRWQGLAGEILEEELVALKATDHGFQKLEQNSFAELLLKPWSSFSSNSQGRSDEDTKELAKSFMPSVEKILSSEATVQKSPSSVFTYAACRSGPSA
jgi:superfamily II DNA/RNA helicase